MSYNRFIALGDSMTEGMQDEKIKGNYRGWAKTTFIAFACTPEP